MTGRHRGPDRRRPSPPVVTEPQRPTEAERRSGGDRRRNGFIANQAFFQGVDYGQLEPVLERCELRLLQPGDTLLQPGQKNHHLYLVLDGLFEVQIQKVPSRDVLTVEPGECIGEISIVDGDPVSAGVVAAAPSRVLAIPEAVLWEDFFKLPRIARNFMALFARRLRHRTDAIRESLEQQLRMEQLRRELRIAHDLQAGMLPDAAALGALYPGLELDALMLPAGEVGGDFFDCFALDDQRLCLAVGDVSGKGIPAALFMVRSMALLRDQIRQHESLTLAVEAVNRLLCQDNPSCMFATVAVGVLDLSSHRFEHVNAGHLPLLYGHDGEDYRYLPSPPGILVGINPLARFTAQSLQLGPGDQLLLYSDGVTEAMNRDDEMYGEQRLCDLLSEQRPCGAAATVRQVRDAVKAFAAGCPQSDDLTLLVLRLSENH